MISELDQCSDKIAQSVTASKQFNSIRDTIRTDKMPTSSKSYRQQHIIPKTKVWTKYVLLLAFVLSITGINSSSIERNVAFVPTLNPRPVHLASSRNSHKVCPSLHTNPFTSELTAASNEDDTMTYAEPRQVARSVIPSVALVIPVGVRNTTARGSGFVIDFSIEDKEDDIIHLLTAAHVAAPGYKIEVVFGTTNGNSSSMPASVVGRDGSADLALLRVNISDVSSTDSSIFAPPPPLKLSDEVAEIGTKSFSIGYPSGGVVGAAMTSGIVCANALGLRTGFGMPSNAGKSEEAINNTKKEDKTRYVVTDAAMAGGMSGGPLVDTKGMVLGVNALVNMELRALGNYAVDASECHDFLSKLRERMDVTKEETPNGSTLPKCDSYRVMLYNDPFNKRARVETILKNVASLNTTEANRIMMDAHTKGRGIVSKFPGDNERSSGDARSLCEALRSEDLLVEVEEFISG